MVRRPGAFDGADSRRKLWDDDVRITAPQASGRYLLEVDLIEEGVRWFGEKTSPPLHIPVVVEERSALALADPPTRSPQTGFARKRSVGPARPDWRPRFRDIRTDIRASPIPGWRKVSAKFALSLAKRALRL